MQILCRGLTEPKELMENSPMCGKLSEPKTAEARQKLTENECLSSCTWKTNPFFKLQPRGPTVHYGIKWYETYFTAENTFPQLHDAPMVPEDLNCLNSCFDKYKHESELLTDIQRKCSAIGIDRQVPTHLQQGTTMVASNFSTIFANDCPPPSPFCLAARIFNPNLDCLVFYETKERTECSTNGVCNFIPGSGGSTTEEDANTKLQAVFQVVQNKSHYYEEEGTSKYTTFDTKYTDKILRSSSPVTKAIKICALAKLLQWYKEGGAAYYPLSYWDGPSIFLRPEVYDLFSGETCDDFMPDVFGSLCTCAGTCAPVDYDPTDKSADRPNNLLHHFATENGLWECQDACRNTTACEFYTHSSVSEYFPTSNYDIFHCFLWRSCDSFQFSRESVYPATWATYPVVPISVHWSGPKDCSVYDQLCPVRGERESYQV